MLTSAGDDDLDAAQRVEQALRLRAAGGSLSTLAAELGVSKATVHTDLRWIPPPRGQRGHVPDARTLPDGRDRAFHTAHVGARRAPAPARTQAAHHG